MNTTNNKWIKFSDQQPVAADFPIWVYDVRDNLVLLFHNPMPTFHRDRTHWKKGPQLPAPPPKELTQRQKDMEANQRIHDAWYSATTRVSLMDFAQRIRADERREILAMLDAECTRLNGSLFGKPNQLSIANGAAVAIRARLETQGE